MTYKRLVNRLRTLGTSLQLPLNSLQAQTSALQNIPIIIKLLKVFLCPFIRD